MMPFIHFRLPGGEEQSIEVTVTRVADGKYDAKSADGMFSVLGASIPLYDDAGQLFDPSMPVPAPSAEDLQQQLLETQAALATMYETLTMIVAGGGL